MQLESIVPPGGPAATPGPLASAVIDLDHYLAPELEPEARDFYRRGLAVLQQAGVPFLVGGAYALAHHAGVVRHTKDFDLFVRPNDSRRALLALQEAGFRTELTFPHWLGKAYHGDHLVDVIFSSGNGLCRVDDGWFEHAEQAKILGVPVPLVPPEEMIWSKGFIQERERFDGADIAHLIRAAGRRLDWARLLGRFGAHWRVLLGHLVMFGYIYPAEREKVPGWVLEGLLGSLRQEMSIVPTAERVCQGAFLSREQYLMDLKRWGYIDPREAPRGEMTPEHIDRWTAAIEQK